MNVGSLFSGAGLLDYGLTLAGWEHAWFCESEADRREILSLRWPGVPVYSDVRDLDGSTPSVDLFAFGFPCRGASSAGLRAGLDHPETALWREAARIIGLIRPRLLLVENVANLLSVRDGDAWAEVVGDLAALGYVFAWDCLPAAAFGAPHLRDRVFLVAAHADGAHELGNGGQRQEQNGRADVGRGDHPPTDAGAGRRRASERPIRRGQPDPERRVAPDAARDGQRGAAAAPGTERERAGAGVEWGQYAAAIERWEKVAGSAPEPLVRGVDDRAARRVVRSRLSALGDGVQVQAGHYLGARLMELARA